MINCVYCGNSTLAQGRVCAYCGKPLNRIAPIPKNPALPPGLIGGLVVLTITASILGLGGVALIAIHFDPTIILGNTSVTSATSQPQTTPYQSQSNSGVTPTPNSGQTTSVSCENVPTDPAGVAATLQIDQSLVGSQQASCPGGKPGGWQIDPNHTGVTVSVSPGMCVDFDPRSMNGLDQSNTQWIDTSSDNLRGRAFVTKATQVTAYGLTVYWSPCYHLS